MRSTGGKIRLGLFGAVLVWAAWFEEAAPFQAASLPGPAALVRQTEGVVRGFLVLRTMDGKIVADGDSLQTSSGREVRNDMIYHFRDGSLQEEISVFTQSGRFKVVSDHLIQKGPAFKHPLDMAIDGATGMVTVHYWEENGKEKTETARLKLPPDLANGIVPVVLKNLAAGTESATASMVVASPKPLLVKLVISKDGEDSFSTGEATHQAIRYRIKIDIGGIRGVLAPLVGKQPADTLVWMLGGPSPCFLRSDGPSAADGPLWRTELASPVWARDTLQLETRRR